MMLATSIIAVMLTYSLTKHLPESFSSKASLATGLVDQTQAQVLDEKKDAQESQINLQFANLIQSIQLKKIFDLVSYQLIIHDLTPNTTPFRKKSKLLAAMKPKEMADAIVLYKKKYEARESLFLYDEAQKKLQDLINSMGYDDESLKKKLTIFRVSNSDFIQLEYEGENPHFCAFVLNTLCSEFIGYYNFIVKENHVKGVNFLDALMHQKRDAMNNKMETLKNYKIQNRILNLNEQARSIYAQIADFESRKELTEKDVLAYTGAIKGIDNMFDPKDRMYLESTLVKVNLEIMSTKEIIKKFAENYVKSNYDPKIRVKLDSLNSILTAQISQLTDKYIVNPLSAKENLVTQKLNLGVQLEISKNSIASLQNKINQLSEQYNKLVPHEAVIQSYETEVDIASKEYIEILQKFNQTTMASDITPRLKQIELAMPGAAAPSKKNLLIAVSGVVPIVLYVVVLFVVFYLDDSLKNARELADKTNIPVLGYLPLLNKSTIDLKEIWANNDLLPKDLQTYKDLLRSTRFEVEQEMKGKKILSVTSLADGEGKSFVTLSLAYAYAMAKKKVLIIDGDFEVPSITDITRPTQLFEDYLDGQIDSQAIALDDGIAILGCKPGDISLFEINDEQSIVEKLAALKEIFDVIIVDATSLDNLNKAKEWIVVSDKVVAVFIANQSINVTKDLMINYLRELNDGQYIGWILNKVSAKKSRLVRIFTKILNRKKKKRKKKDD